MIVADPYSGERELGNDMLGLWIARGASEICTHVQMWMVWGDNQCGEVGD